MRSTMDKIMQDLVENVKAQPWEDAEFYKEYLAQSFYYTAYSVKMLAHAASLTSPEQTSYYKRSLQHLREEYGHDSLALADLKKLGGKIEDHKELGLTRSLYEPQFFKIQRQPTALLGYILALEYLCVSYYKELHQRLEAHYGKTTTHFVRVHAEEDPDHVDKAMAQIEALPEAERAAVWINYEQTCRMFGAFLTECAAQAHQGAVVPLKSARRSEGRGSLNPGLKRVS